MGLRLRALLIVHLLAVQHHHAEQTFHACSGGHKNATDWTGVPGLDASGFVVLTPADGVSVTGTYPYAGWSCGYHTDSQCLLSYWVT